MKETTTNVETGLEVAVIGLAGRFPGAKNIAEFWINLKNGIESISFLSEAELAEISPELRNNPNFVNTKGGVLEDIEYFDAPFFNYTPLEAEHMLPSLRILHECLWTALEDASYPPESCSGLIGVYAGLPPADDWRLISKASPDAEQSMMAANFLNNRDFLSALVSYKLNLVGPAFVINTACSTSLVAVHLACQGLLSGDCDMALASGVSINYVGIKGYLYQEGGIQSHDGHCRTFDESADGTRGGDGAGVVVLKRLEDAAADGDHIYAVIKGSAINNDGNRKVGFTAPSIDGQAYVIRKALKMAEINLETIRFIEAHGTATPLGDVTEVEALKIAFNTDKKHFCALGSVKTNVGHLDAAAGITGFIKAVLALKYRMIPPSLLFKKPNPKIDFENSPFYVNATLKDLKNEEPPICAGVSSFGIGGTNAHVVLEEYGGALFEKTAPSSPPSPPAKTFNLFLLSAKTQSSLDKMTENLAHFLTENPTAHFANLADIAYTLQIGRKHFPYRRKLVSHSIQDIIAKLSAPGSRNTPFNHLTSEEKERNVVFMFPGLGPQYTNMGRGLYQTEPLFRQTMDHCFEILTPLGYDLKKIIYPGKPDSSDLSDLSNIHPFD
ncbi:MAG TPA: type I polyketide synthase, partial [Candidatus Deferrimicrobium sp.]|nr:type I polyketide synthase [Candidatus Deferrimicrobium sp.]